MEILNLEMLALLQAAGVTWPLDPRLSAPGVVPVVEVIKGCVFLKSEYDRNKDRAKLESFPDKTELESFINHVHLPFTGTRESLLSCLSYAASLREALMPLTQSHRFRVELSISDNDEFPRTACRVSFHQTTPSDISSSEEAEEFKSEAILVFDVPPSDT